MKALIFTFHTREPLLIPSYRPGDENSAESLNYIPGSIVRGMFIQHYAHDLNEALDAADPVFRRLFLDGSVRYLNAYPIDHQDQRALPTPLSWRIRKNDKGRDHFDISDFAVEWNDDLEQPTSVSKLFCHIDDEGDVVFSDPARLVRYHNASFQRMKKSKGDSTVFRYESIAPEETFAAVVLAEDDADLELVKSLLTEHPHAHLGKSRRAGYGTVEIEGAKIVPDWQEFHLSDEDENDRLTLTLLSDTILRDPETGQWTTNLGKVLDKEVQEVFSTTTVVGGVNSKWGLPLPQTPALQAGSVFRFVSNAFSEEERQLWVAQGIGERRAEGFGRVAIQWQGRETYRVYSLSNRREPSEVIELDSRSQALAQRMAERMLRAELDRKLQDALASLEISGNISNAQLSRLRLTARRAQEANSWTPIQKFLHKDNLKSTAQRQLERAKVNKRTQLFTWLQHAVQLDEEKQIVTEWSLWDDYIAKGSELTARVGNIEATPDDSMKLEYTLHLIDALLHKASRKGGKA